MLLKLIGAILVIGGSAGFGIVISVSHRKTVRHLQQLIAAVNYMECELQYRLTPLPELCCKASAMGSGCIKRFFTALENELNTQIRPDPHSCVQSVLSRTMDMPLCIQKQIAELGCTLGQFGLEGQLEGFRKVRISCEQALEKLTTNQDVRLRSYQTLAVCAGAALAILFI